MAYGLLNNIASIDLAYFECSIGSWDHMEEKKKYLFVSKHEDDVSSEPDIFSALNIKQSKVSEMSCD